MTSNVSLELIPENGKAIVEIAKCDCGYSFTTRYVDAEGATIRRDCHIAVLQGTLVGAETGKVG